MLSGIVRGRPARWATWLSACSLVAAYAAAAIVAPRAATAQQEPSDAEQLAIYELNVARADPPAYARSVGLGRLLDNVSPRPPLAVNPHLVQSARFHAAEMAIYDYFGHQSAITGDWPNKMVRDAGYPLVSSWSNRENFVESIAAGFTSFQSALRALIEDEGIDPPGHRIHLLGLQSFWLSQREIGTGYAFRANSIYGHYYAYHTGQRNSNRPFITGVVYDDRNGNHRYDFAEGLGGVTIRVNGATTTAVTSMNAGGYAVRVDGSGMHVLEVSGGPFEGTVIAAVNVMSNNVAVDFVSGRPDAQIGFDGVPTGAGTVIRFGGTGACRLVTGLPSERSAAWRPALLIGGLVLGLVLLVLLRVRLWQRAGA